RFLIVGSRALVGVGVVRFRATVLVSLLLLRPPLEVIVHVSIDGVEYAPVGKGGGPRVGVAVTTHNRPEVLARTLDHIMARTPGAVVVVVDDGSKVPVTVPDGVV